VRRKLAQQHFQLGEAERARKQCRRSGADALVLRIQREDVVLGPWSSRAISVNAAAWRLNSSGASGNGAGTALGTPPWKPPAQATFWAKAFRSPTARIAMARPCETQVSMSSGPSADPPA